MKHNNLINQFVEYLNLAGMATSTIRQYKKILVDWLAYVSDPYFATTQDLINFAIQKHSVAHRKQVQGVFKHFYRKIIPMPQILCKLPKIKKQRKIPVILTEIEAHKVIGGLFNLKHRAILSVMYYGALRISEVTNIKIIDINGQENTLHVKQSKGAADRIVPLPPDCVELLRAYYKKYRPKLYLFNSYKKGDKYSVKSVRKVLLRALELQGIKKHITPHSLRHSRATHLLANGVGIKFIQQLLGHKNIKTTEVYLHLTPNMLQDQIIKADKIIQLKSTIAA